MTVVTLLGSRPSGLSCVSALGLTLCLWLGLHCDGASADGCPSAHRALAAGSLSLPHLLRSPGSQHRAGAAAGAGHGGWLCAGVLGKLVLPGGTAGQCRGPTRIRIC